MKDLPTLISERLTQNLWGVLGNQGYILGIDLGSYGLRAALVDLQHHTYHNAAIESVDHEDPETTVAKVIALVHDLMAREGVTVDRLVRVGVGFSGPVDLRHGTVRLAPRRRLGKLSVARAV